ncbi:MAG TPA: amylo-alpha-1,6-glucosidase [Gammaproteobacteria bacterium]|nr:amylo-alpha-1,6-glucosidase [Gammaproteobacteria bacterium]
METRLEPAGRRRAGKPYGREWLVTNGLGGYASGTIAGLPTRRYHGLLIAALAAPFGRRMLFAHAFERLRLEDGSWAELGASPECGGEMNCDVHGNLAEFRLELGLPVWRYTIGGTLLEKRIVLPHGQNTVHLLYRHVEGPAPLELELRICLQSRSHDDEVDAQGPADFTLVEANGRYEVDVPDGLPPLRFIAHGERSAFIVERAEIELDYSLEAARGYPYRGRLESPGYFRIDLGAASSAALVATCESWEAVEALRPQEALRAERARRTRLVEAAPDNAREGFAAELVLAADAFLVTPVGRTEDTAFTHAEGGEARTIIAGYHWFTDWGRDTMISLDGLTLATGRAAEAGYILRMFAHYVRDGLLPNLFPEREKQGLYHTADATLWFFHALDRYLSATGDESGLRQLLPRLVDIASKHLAGTRFGIGVDPADGLLRQGEQGYQLTWMDAKVGDWVVTPRRGKAVEINALWYNALRLLAGWLGGVGREKEALEWARHAERARISFNRRFWYEAGGYLYDVVDGEQGDDAALRPNQVIAISLSHPILERSRWRAVLEAVRLELLTPYGLRTLAPSHPDYSPRYCGDRRSRDAAYHQGTVWPWLIGPFVDASLKAFPEDKARAHGFLAAFEQHFHEAGLGSISEIFDAETPYAPRGCIAQAWSVAEVLRSWVKTQDQPASPS